MADAEAAAGGEAGACRTRKSLWDDEREIRPTHSVVDARRAHHTHTTTYPLLGASGPFGGGGGRWRGEGHQRSGRVRHVWHQLGSPHVGALLRPAPDAPDGQGRVGAQADPGRVLLWRPLGGGGGAVVRRVFVSTMRVGLRRPLWSIDRWVDRQTGSRRMQKQKHVDAPPWPAWACAPRTRRSGRASCTGSRGACRRTYGCGPDGVRACG